MLIFFASGGARAEAGQHCPSFTLTHSFDGLRTSMKQLVPESYQTDSIETCVSNRRMSLFNHGPICEISPDVEVVISIAVGPSKDNELLALTYLLPYSVKSDALIRKFTDERQIIVLEKAPKFMIPIIANAAESILVEDSVADSWLLITKEKGPAMLVDKDFTVLRLFRRSEFETFHDLLTSCFKG
jgi:hypothetical protein